MFAKLMLKTAAMLHSVAAATQVDAIRAAINADLAVVCKEMATNTSVVLVAEYEGLIVDLKATREVAVEEALTLAQEADVEEEVVNTSYASLVWTYVPTKEEKEKSATLLEELQILINNSNTTSAKKAKAARIVLRKMKKLATSSEAEMLQNLINKADKQLLAEVKQLIA